MRDAIRYFPPCDALEFSIHLTNVEKIRFYYDQAEPPELFVTIKVGDRRRHSTIRKKVWCLLLVIHKKGTV